MKIIKYAIITILSGILLTANALAQTVLIDFGDTIAAATTANGDTWNAMLAPSFMSNLLDTTGTATTWDIGTVSGSFGENGGVAGGGLASPSFALLGNLANADATNDYFFTADTVNASVITIQGLDSTKQYTLDFFGTRDTTGTRETIYSIVDGSPLSTGILQTSGTGAGTVGTGNDDDIISLGNITPDGSGRIDFSFGVESGGFGYLGAMRITQVPEPSTFALFAISGLAGIIVYRRRK